MDSKALKRRRRRKIKITVFLVLLLAVVPGLYIWLYWDYHVSWYLFDRYCNDEDVAGLHVYERVGLDASYFKPDKDLSARDMLSMGYLPDSGRLIDLELLKQNYTYQLVDFSRVSDIGPISLMRSTIKRRSDGVLLGEYRNYRNLQGKTARLVSLNHSSIFCGFIDEDGEPSNSPTRWDELFRGVFYYSD